MADLLRHVTEDAKLPIQKRCPTTLGTFDFDAGRLSQLPTGQAESSLSAKRYSSWWVVRFVLLLGVSPGDDLAVGPRHLRNLAHPSRT